MGKILLGATANADAKPVEAPLNMLTRHGLITGATGTGKTITLQVIAEQLSLQGVPVFMSDVKGDLSGISEAGTPHEKITERVKHIEIEEFYQFGLPTVFWDLLGKRGHPVRTTISEMGPILLGRLLDLSDTQEAVLHMAFKIADDHGWLLLDLEDLQSLLLWMDNHASDVKENYGNITSSTIGSIQRALLVLEESGGEKFFGEPELDLQDLMRQDFSGNSIVNILDAKDLMIDPRLYGTFLLWLLSEMFETLPEVGDIDQPKLAMFFDEAHLIFRDAPKVLVQKIEQVVRLIRSKGVSVWFVTQNPLDIPDGIRGQLGNRVMHALRSYTPEDQKAVRAAAETFRPNKEFDAETLLTELEVGYALVSTLDEDGRPQPVQHTMMRPPHSRIGAITDEERQVKIGYSPLKGKYDEAIDRESAHEILEKLVLESKTEDKRQKTKEKKGLFSDLLAAGTGGGKRQGYAESFMKTMVRSTSTKLATKLVRGILGSLGK